MNKKPTPNWNVCARCSRFSVNFGVIRSKRWWCLGTIVNIRISEKSPIPTNCHKILEHAVAAAMRDKDA